MSYFDVVPRLPPSSSVFVNFPVKCKHCAWNHCGSSKYDPKQPRLNWLCRIRFNLPINFVLVLSIFCVVVKQTEMTNEEFWVFSETLLAEDGSTKCTVMGEYSEVFRAMEENYEEGWKLVAPDFPLLKGILSWFQLDIGYTDISR